jgi:hypothetical protein
MNFFQNLLHTYIIQPYRKGLQEKKEMEAIEAAFGSYRPEEPKKTPKKEKPMDKQIRKIEKDDKKVAKGLKSLEKADKKRDKVCEMGEKAMKKKKK